MGILNLPVPVGFFLTFEVRVRHYRCLMGYWFVFILQSEFTICNLVELYVQILYDNGHLFHTTSKALAHI